MMSTLHSFGWSAAHHSRNTSPTLTEVQLTECTETHEQMNKKQKLISYTAAFHVSFSKMRYWLLISFIWFFVGVREHGFFQAGGAATLTVGAELPHSELCVQNRKILTVFNKLRQSAISFFLNLAVIFIGVAVAFVLMQCHRYLKNHWTNENSSPRGRRMSAEEENSSSVS